MISPILACKNVQQAIDYYVESLSFELAWAMPPNDDGETEFAGVKLDGSEIMLGVTQGFVSDADLDRRGLGVQIYINLSHALDIETYYAQIKSQGAVIEKPLETKPWGEKAFTLRDLDGYNLMVAQAPEENLG